MPETTGQTNSVYDPDSEKPVTQPNLPAIRAGENPQTSSTGSRGGGSTSSSRSSGRGSTSGTNAGTPGGSTSSASGGTEGGSSSGTSETPSKQSLRDREESGGEDSDEDDNDDILGRGYTGSTNSTSKEKTRFKITRRRAAAGGGATGVLIAMIIGGASILQGPFEFVHLAQLMEKFHFSSQEDAQDSRLTKIARYIRDPSKPQNTRMGIVGNAVANKLEAKIHEATGLTPEFDRNGKSLGYAVDREHPLYKDLTTNQIKDKMASLGINRATIETVGNTPDGKQALRVDPEKNIRSIRNPIKAYFAQTKFARFLLTKAGYSKLPTHVGARALSTRAGWEFHPIRKLDAEIRNKILEAGRKGYDKLKEKFATDQAQLETKGKVPAGGESRAGATTDPAGDTLPPTSDAEKTSAGINELKTDSSKIDPIHPETEKEFRDKTKAKIQKAGGAAAVGLGIGCVIQSLSKNINQEKQAKAILPMMRKAGQAISLGSQIQSGQDISMEQLSLFKDLLNEKDASGNVTSSWNQARSIQAEEGVPNNGPDIPEEGQVFTKGNPLDFLDNVKPLTAACSVLGSTFGQVFGIVTGPIAYVVTGQALERGIPLLSHWLSGEPISPVAAGADYGNYVNYGSRLSANDQYASVGGTEMSSADELALKTVGNDLDNQDFQKKSFAYRIFNPKDSQTVVSKLIDNYGSSVSTQNVASLFRSFGSIFTAALKTPGTLLSGFTHADTAYDYHGLKKVGFTAEELADIRVENPFENACKVTGGDGCTGAAIFDDSAKADKYTALAKKCFGVDIGSGPEWNINSKTASVNFEDSSFPDDCKLAGDEDWFRVRFWLLDTATIEGYDCTTDSASSDQSCNDIGFTNSGASTTDAAPVFSGSLDKSHIFEDSTNVPCASGTKDMGTQDGYHDGSLVKIKVCAVSNTPITAGSYQLPNSDGKVVVNSRVSGAFYKMTEAAKADGVTLSTTSGFRTMAQQKILCAQNADCAAGNNTAVAKPGESNHQMGVAVDFSISGILNTRDNCPPLPTKCEAKGHKEWDWLDAHANEFGLQQYKAEFWHFSPNGK